VTNRLAETSSAYLRSAAHQPIHWYPWGEEAFTAAAVGDKPVLLDIGAVWCHWCHVMDGESYEDPSIAEFLNGNFICIKVDRDERPDVDARYQRAVQALTRQGGWPLTAFLTPEGQVFYGGTYFPPDGKYGRPGLRTVLASVLDAWRTRRGQLEAQAAAIRDAVLRHGDESAPAELSPAIIDAAVDGMIQVFDPVNGGFGSQPKFPHPGAIRFLLARWWEDPRSQLRTVVDGTLEGMARGGIRDHLGGGFHRYSVDAEWIVPHFEKMVYDNAELLRAYTDAYAAFGTTAYAEVGRDIIRWVREVASEPEGGYAASQDADVGADDDGDYFTWTRDEASAALTAEELAVAAEFYDIGTAGEMHHNPAKNVLYSPVAIEAMARRLRLPEERAVELLRSARDKMRAVRATRPAPFVDHTRYANWNAMMASALLNAGAVLNDPWAQSHALLTLRRLRAECPEPDAVPHTASGPGGLLEDQVLVAAAALDAFETTGETEWLEWSRSIMTRVWRDYRDETRGGLFDRTGQAGEKGLLPSRLKPLEDAPTPSANGVAGVVLGRLAELTGDRTWRDRAGELLRAFAGEVARLGLHAATYLIALDWHLHPATHFVVVGKSGDSDSVDMHHAALATYAPRRVARWISADAAAETSLPPTLRAMLDRDVVPAGYACLGDACMAPALTKSAWEQTLLSVGPQVRLSAP